jgi:hypothetical protein
VSYDAQYYRETDEAKALNLTSGWVVHRVADTEAEALHSAIADSGLVAHRKAGRRRWRVVSPDAVVVWSVHRTSGYALVDRGDFGTP